MTPRNAPVRRPVVQLDPTGCGIASVAAITELPYVRVRAVARSLGISAQDPLLWSGTGHVRRLLAHLGVKVARRERPFQSWDALPGLALLAVKWHLQKGRPCWHWVVFVRDAEGPRVLDSKRGLRHHVRTDFGRINPKWFIPVAKLPQVTAPGSAPDRPSFPVERPDLVPGSRAFR